MNGLIGAAPPSTNAAVMASGAKAPGGFWLGSTNGQAPAVDHSQAQALANQTSAADGEQDVLSTAQRSMLKWEKEEALGEMATVAPVLYCNTNFPQLREQYPGRDTSDLQHYLLSLFGSPKVHQESLSCESERTIYRALMVTDNGPFSEWSTRVKQIAKLWRKACSQDRAPFVVSFLLAAPGPVSMLVWPLSSCHLRCLLGSKKLGITGQLSASVRFSSAAIRSNGSRPQLRRHQQPTSLLAWRLRGASRIRSGPESRSRSRSGSSAR